MLVPTLFWQQANAAWQGEFQTIPSQALTMTFVPESAGSYFPMRNHNLQPLLSCLIASVCGRKVYLNMSLAHRLPGPRPLSNSHTEPRSACLLETLRSVRAADMTGQNASAKLPTLLEPCPNTAKHRLKNSACPMTICLLRCGARRSTMIANTEARWKHGSTSRRTTYLLWVTPDKL